MPSANLLVIGNELLNGEIRDKNIHTLCQQLTRLGFTVERVAMVRDDPARIADALAYVLREHPELVFCSGGLGPTADDLTLGSLASALGLPLALDASAAAMVEQHYDALLAQGFVAQRGPEAARFKMATLPQGAQPLHNPIGTAPGVRLSYEATTLYILPGVPAELEAILAETIVPELQQHYPRSVWIEGALMVLCQDEADLALPLQTIAARHSEVYLKSLAVPFSEAGEVGLRVIAAARAPDPASAQDRVDACLLDLRRELLAVGLRVADAPC